MALVCEGMRGRMLRRRAAIGLGCGMLAAPAARATEAPRPTLVVSGRIGAPDPGSTERRFSLEALEALGMAEFTTVTPWTPNPRRFSGVPLRKLLEAVRAQGRELHVTALNDYRSVIPVADGVAAGALLATRMEGSPIRIRDFGPVWIVFPWSDRPELDRPALHHYAVWQLARIEVR
ncbi:molybdopterin-dependent oxidoreductase [Teichococcus oryzae]|uniref:Molybdopterin-dependent oxidoreductase n=1 Tax=Teichococcus oryzae TaxID=1608942 RepID=A0A5B2TGX3_9PROT|nr:molybdopterin-dependent oxidoreductase [Pseudoroseomonas oryzae]KAA2213245.1 molybdopterin-dependent oxidoreductase [Pseudoroseomonas oryzae]